jgi:glycosyltransferase involved in cell wall biosynthesis
MELPKISIITVTYNAEKIVSATIESVLAQTYPNIEYIVVDGASKDTTFDLVQKYAAIAPTRLVKTLSERDKNNYDAMNKGLRLATGDFVWFLHAGDLIPAPDTLEKVMAGYAGEDFIYGEAEIKALDGSIRPFHKKLPPAEGLTWRTFRNGMLVCHQAMLMRRTAAVEYDFERYGIAADLDWTIRSLQNTKQGVRNVELQLCSFLAGGLSQQHRWRGLRERFRIMWRHFGFFATVWEHVLILFQALRRGSIGNN